MPCPYCGGYLVFALKHASYKYDCTRCDRGWNKGEHGEWIALFDAGNTLYTKEQARDRLRES